MGVDGWDQMWDRYVTSVSVLGSVQRVVISFGIGTDVVIGFGVGTDAKASGSNLGSVRTSKRVGIRFGIGTDELELVDELWRVWTAGCVVSIWKICRVLGVARFLLFVFVFEQAREIA